MSASASVLRGPTGPAEAPARSLRSRAWAIVGALAITETISWGILYYAFAVFIAPMHGELGWSTAQLTGAFSLALLVSAIAGIAVGRYLDRHSPRGLMTAGSLAGVVLVLAWSQVDDLLAFYAIWALMGVVLATVLYEPAFTVLAKTFPDPDERRRAMTAMTLVAALASFIFLPLAQALIDAHGWRDTLVVLALILAVTTIPLHALVLRRPTAPATEDSARDTPPSASIEARIALRSVPFWLLTGAFVLATIASIAMTIHAIPFLIERGHTPAFAAFAVGLIGISQIPGRLLFTPLAARLPPERSTTAVFGLIAIGTTTVVAFDTTPTVLAGLVVLGMGNGMTTLLRATRTADLYGSDAYGTIAGIAASTTTAARAGGPFAASVYAAAVGYDMLLWSLAAIVVLAACLAYRAGMQS